MKNTILILVLMVSATFAQVKIDLPYDIVCKSDGGKYSTFTVATVTALPPFAINIRSHEGCSVTLCLRGAPESAEITINNKISTVRKPVCADSLSEVGTESARTLFYEVVERIPTATEKFKAK